MKSNEVKSNKQKYDEEMGKAMECINALHLDRMFKEGKGDKKYFLTTAQRFKITNKKIRHWHNADKIKKHL